MTRVKRFTISWLFLWLFSAGIRTLLHAQTTGPLTPEKSVSLLGEQLVRGTAVIWHLYHSGFAIKTSSHFLIFDYRERESLKPGQSLIHGVIDPAELKGQRVVVFISHEHYDHFFRDAIKWSSQIENIQYVVSTEVTQADPRYAAQANRITVVGADETRHIGQIGLRTFKATDSGVAFLLKVDGLMIYHSGDHANWNWKNRSNASVIFRQQELAGIPGDSIDIAMQVCDARLAGKGWGGFFDVAEHLRPQLIIPMHLNDDYSVTSRLNEITSERKIKVAVWAVEFSGQGYFFSRAHK